MFPAGGVLGHCQLPDVGVLGTKLGSSGNAARDLESYV